MEAMIDGKEYLCHNQEGWMLLSWVDFIGAFDFYIQLGDCDKIIPLDLALRAPELQAENTQLTEALRGAGCEMSTKSIYIADLERENERLRSVLQAAEKYIDASVGDVDATDMAWSAWEEYQAAKGE